MPGPDLTAERLHKVEERLRGLEIEQAKDSGRITAAQHTANGAKATAAATATNTQHDLEALRTALQNLQLALTTMDGRLVEQRTRLDVLRSDLDEHKKASKTRESQTRSDGWHRLQNILTLIGILVSITLGILALMSAKP